MTDRAATHSLLFRNIVDYEYWRAVVVIDDFHMIYPFGIVCTDFILMFAANGGVTLELDQYTHLLHDGPRLTHANITDILDRAADDIERQANCNVNIGVPYIKFSVAGNILCLYQGDFVSYVFVLDDAARLSFVTAIREHVRFRRCADGVDSHVLL